jgi:hypothetical protein
LVLRAAGINCDMETEWALKLAGAETDRIHINRIIENKGLLEDYQIPFAVVSDGKTAILLDTVSGKKTGLGMAAIPSKKKVTSMLELYQPVRLAADRLEREKLIFRTYDIENVNIQRIV